MQWDELSDIQADKGFIACAQYIADTSNRGDVIEDISTDQNFILAAWTGRREWVSLIYPWNKGERCRNPECIDRLAQVKAWSLMTNSAQIRVFASRENIRWVIIDPGIALGWPDELTSKAVFTSSGYKVLRLF